MLKWLAGSSPARSSSDHPRPQRLRRPRVTDDPLATIRVHKVDRPLEIYAVSRVNPIFDEEEDNILKAGGAVPRREFVYHPHRHLRKDHGSPEFPGKSASSGYGSNRYNSSSEYSSSGAEETTGSQHMFPGALSEDESPKKRSATTNFRDDATTVLEQNMGFVKSILVAVRGNNANASPRTTSGRHARRPSGASAATLSPIPEGKVDYTIPRPVWPKDDKGRRHCENVRIPDPPQFEDPSHVAPPDSIVDDALLLYTSFTYTPSDGNSQIAQDGNSTAVTNVSTLSQLTADKQHTLTSHEILREISNTISEAIESKQIPSPEDVLKGLSNTINNKLEALQTSPLSVSSEDALRNLSVTLSHREPLTKMSRALSNSSSSSGGSLRAGNSPQDDADTARLLLLQRLGSAREQWQKHCAKSESSTRTNRGTRQTVRKTRNISVDNLLPPRESSSSSASSSGFSDLTQTPTSSDSPPSQRGGGQVLAHPPVFLHDDLSSVPNSVRNAMIYGTLCRLNTKSGFNSAYEKLLSSQKNGASVRDGAKDGVANVQQEQDRSLWETYSGTGVAAGDVHLKPAESYYYVSTTTTLVDSLA
ncbi:hypothetical protein C0J52_10540 [Blattella germanica]|nr:hypothetical protein C0J52_10540 [Blattella germanica]